MTAAVVDNPGASAAAIAHHYDVPGEFYALWLDESMTYSCARWHDDDTLESAQLRKIDYHADCARVRPGARVLDVGCGWGATMARLVDRYSAGEVVGLTLSRAQAAFAAARSIPRAEVRVESWSEHRPDRPYDAIISIGAFEHFARPGRPMAEKVSGYRAFFERCRDWLKPAGHLSLQTIAYGNMRPEQQSSFLMEVYPESELPTLSEILAASGGLFEPVLVRNDRQDYARTCREWLRRLRARRQEAIALVGDEVVARYERYLQYCIVGFHVGNTYLLRIDLARIDPGHRAA